MRGPRIHTRPLRTRTAWVLIIGVLLQPLLTYLITPLIADNGRGNHVLICTLNGMKEVRVDPSATDLHNQYNDEDCPALRLAQLVSSAGLAAPLTLPPLALYAVDLVDSDGSDQCCSPCVPCYASRAPPLA